MIEHRRSRGVRQLAEGWRAAAADDHLRRSYTEADFDDADWHPINVPGHWRSSAAFADSDGPLLYRCRFDAAAPDAGAPGLVDVRRPLLPGRRLARRRLPGRHRGLLRPPQRSRSPGALRARSEHAVAVEVTCTPQHGSATKRNITGIFQHWDAVDPTWNPGGLWRPVRFDRDRARAHRQPAGRLRRGDARTGRPRPPGACSTATRPDGCGCAPRWAHRPRGRPAAGRRRQRGELVGHDRPARRCGGPAPSATPRCTTCGWRSCCPGTATERRPRGATTAGTTASRRSCPTSPAPSATSDGCAPACGRSAPPVDRLGQRRAPVPQGHQPGPHPHGARRGHRRRAATRRRPRRRRRARPRARPRPRDPRRGLRPRPTSAGCSCGRTCRCSGPTPAASASRPRARRGRWSTCSATTRRSPCGAGTTSRCPTSGPTRPTGTAARRSPSPPA